jgi:hypothetical protein
MDVQTKIKMEVKESVQRQRVAHLYGNNLSDMGSIVFIWVLPLYWALVSSLGLSYFHKIAPRLDDDQGS